MEFYEAMKTRRSQYDITKESPISQQRIEEIVKEAITLTPSAFHSQTSRVVLLFGERHKALWMIVKTTLQAIVPADKFVQTQEKIDSFMAGTGSILYLEDIEAVENLQAEFPAYAENFPIWSNQSSGMLQFAIWTALASEGLGASLQHYNPLIDAEIAQAFGYSKKWKLIAQMPFGQVKTPANSLVYKPIEERIIIQGAIK